jgi:predicted acetyltransferase
MGREGNWVQQEIWVRDFVALTGDAYLGLWRHLLTHDLANSLVWEPHPDDRLHDMVEDPFKIDVTTTEGAMVRIVDLERAIEQRPYLGERPAAATIRVQDANLPWNDGTWRIEGAEGRMRAERTDAAPEAEMSVNALAPLFTGYIRPEVATASGFINVDSPETAAELTRLFAVADPPYCPEFY